MRSMVDHTASYRCSAAIESTSSSQAQSEVNPQQFSGQLPDPPSSEMPMAMKNLRLIQRPAAKKVKSKD